MRYRVKSTTSRFRLVTRGFISSDHDRARALKVGVITAQIYRAGVHLDRRIAIQRAQYDAFNKVNPRCTPSRSDGRDLSETVHGE